MHHDADAASFTLLDLLLVHRRRTFRSFRAGPVSWLISRRIQALSGSRWNHVAVSVGHGQLVEAEWGGIVRTPLSAYLRQQERGIVDLERIPRPNGVAPDAAAVGVAWLLGQVGKGRYDYRTIVAMRMAALLWGHDGIRRITQPIDDAWICSELAAAAWAAAGFDARLTEVQTPGDFHRLYGRTDA